MRSIGFRRPWAFWLGVTAVTAGVALHLPMYLGASADHYMLSGMPMDGWMLVGMVLMVVGYAGVLWGVAPGFRRPDHEVSALEFESLEENKLTGAHVKLMLVLMLAVAVDTQKPFTFTFILPGVATEYDLRSPSHPAPGHWPVALFPFVAILGTVVGSLLWGRLGDSIGRRASILLAATLFIGTAMCGAMPAFHWNLVACFVMGLSAGGLLPIAYSLLAETIPARRRGEAIVLVAGLGTALGFLIASWTAHWLIPTYSWRVMWFFGVPTGLALILLNRFIPESPRFLFATGRADQAREVMRSFGIKVREPGADEPAETPTVQPGFASVFRRPFHVVTPVLIVYGLAWGLVNYGFLVWLPVYVAKSGVTAGQVTTVLAKAALFAIPGSLVVAWLYGRWSSRGTLVLAATVEAATLLVFAVHPAVVENPRAFTALVVLLLISLWATVSAVAPYAAEIYPTAIRGAGSGVVAGATKLGGVLALAIAVLSWAPPSVTGAAILGAIPACTAAVLLLFYGVETRGRSLEQIERAERSGPREQRTLTIGGRTYPVIFPSWKDPRLHLSLTFVCLHTLGQVFFHFRLSIPQILTALLVCGLIEVVVTFGRSRVVLWPASALLTGNGIAFIMRIPGTQHGDWWSTNGLWIYAAVGAVSMASKYLIQFRGRHIFNPSNLGLVLCFLILGSDRAEPLQFWWGPISPALLVVLGTIVAGALMILSRVGVLTVAILFWVTFAAGMGILAASGHAFSANWHLGPVADFYFWKVLITSPEVFIFLSFMITDPKTVPETARGRRIYAVAIGVLASLMIAPMQTEFAAKVALLGSLTIVCLARPLILLGRERLAQRRTFRAPRRRSAIVLAVLGAAAFAGVVVVAGSPARSFAGVASLTGMSNVKVTIERTPGVASIDQATGNRVAADAIGDLQLASEALSKRSLTTAAQCAGGAYLVSMRTQIAGSAGKAIVVPSYRVESVALKLQPAVGQAPPTIVATVSGTVTRLSYSSPAATTATSGASKSFVGRFDLALSGSRFLLIGRGTSLPAPKPATIAQGYDKAPKGTAAFAKAVHLVNVAPKVGLDFHQDAFRYGITYDPQAMMGGGVCWLDYDNDGWLDLFAVNSYADVDTPQWNAKGGFPPSALFRNEHGTFTNVTKSSHAGLRVKGTGCVAADLNGDGYADLVVTTATGIDLLWNNGNGTFTQGAAAAGIRPPYDWYASASVADVNGDGRPDLFVAGYTNLLEPIKSSIAGFPTNFQGVRDLLYLNEGNGHFKEVGAQVGLEAAHFSHGLGSVFTDVNGDGRPDLYVANDEDPNQLYLDEPGGPLGFHFVNVATGLGVADPNAGMGVAEGDFNGDGRPDLFITNSRGQPHAAYQSGVRNGETFYAPEMAKFGQALERKATVGWGDSWVDLSNDGKLDLVLANGAIPVTNVKHDTEPMQVLQNLGDASFTLASGVIQTKGMPRIIGRGVAAADFDNDGRIGLAVNSIDGPLVLLENTAKVGNWLEVSLKGFHPGAVVTVTLPNGQTLVDELHAGSSYLSSEDPRAHFGLGAQTTVKTLTIRYPDGKSIRLHNLRANHIVRVG